MSNITHTLPRHLPVLLRTDYVREEIGDLISDNIEADVTDFEYIEASNTLILTTPGPVTDTELASLVEELENLQNYDSVL